MENCGTCMHVYQFGTVQLMWGIMQMYCSQWHSQILDYIPYINALSYYASCTTHHCLHMKSFSISLCLLLSFCCISNVPACFNVSHPPYWLLIYDSYPGLSLLPPEGSIDGPICRVCHQENCLMSTNIMNILLTTCGLQEFRFR